MRTTVSQPQQECIVIEHGRAWVRAALLLAVIGAWSGVLWMLGDGPGHILWLIFGTVVVPAAAIWALRALHRRRRSLVRTPGRLLLEGEPIELARVELRVTKFPVTRVPTGYQLSLWVMTSSGPEDIPLGHFATLLDASRLSGIFEEFVQRANVKQAGRLSLR